MTNTATPAFVTGLAELAPAYRALLSDVWGVVHNGEQAHAAAVDALSRYRAAGGSVLLITNAARSKADIVSMLDGFGVARDAYDDVLSSGDATHDLLAGKPGARVFAIGAERNLPIYDGLPLTLTDAESCDLICCASLFDDETETPDDYQDRLVAWRARGLPMICANPDIVVERGGKLVWCAGSLAERYRALGGETIMVGKPHAPIYAAALQRIAGLVGEPVAPQSVLAIGDAIATDVRGAVEQGMDVLFVTAGIHAADFGERDAPDLDKVHANLAKAGLAARAVIPRLVWGNDA